MWGYGFGWGWPLLVFGTVLWIAVLVVLIWALMRWVSHKTSTPPPTMEHMPPSRPSALEILQQRYARGEIDTATFEQMRERLEASSARGPQRSESRQPASVGR